MPKVWTWQDEEVWDAAKSRGPSGLRFWTISELMAVKTDVAQEGDTFGNWTYHVNGGAAYLEIGYGYGIDIERCQTAEQCWDWVNHMAGKTWITPEDLGWFIFALSVIKDDP